MKKSLITSIVCVLVSASFPIANSQAAEDDWEVRVVPFVWATGLSGELGPAERPASVRLDFGDILEVTEAGFVGEIDATYKDEWFFAVEGQYLELEESGDGPMGGRVNVESTFGIATFGAGKRVAENIDITAGGRYIYMDTDVSLAGEGTIGSTEKWVDPVVGFRLRGRVNDKMFVRLAMDVGGFGLNSDITYAFASNFNYEFNHRYSAIFGYRMLDVDYDKNGFVFDAKMDGLLLGLGITF